MAKRPGTKPVSYTHLDVYKRQTYTCAVYSTFFSLLPPVIAIVLALNTKEVYTSLLVGIASGALPVSYTHL